MSEDNRSSGITLFVPIALLTGFGGLLFEIVAIRWSVVLVGAGSLALGLVVGAFLLGLGLGSRLLPDRRMLQGAPLRSAALLYTLLSVVLAPVCVALQVIRPAGAAWTPLACFVLAFAPAFVMGGAFPLLVAGMTRRRGGRGVGLLQGANLFGSVFGATLGGVWLLPQHGMWPATWVAALAYLSAGLLGLLSASLPPDRATAGPETQPSAPLRHDLLLAAGFATLVLQVWLPRRLGFFLGSYLPTLTGSLVAVLLGLALGSFLAEARATRQSRHERLGWLAGLGFGISLVLIEVLGPELAQWPLHDTWQQLLVASLAPCVLALPATVPLGAVLPSVLTAAADRRGLAPGVAGRGFFLFSFGAALGSLLVPLLFVLPEPLRMLPLVGALPLVLASREAKPALIVVTGLLAAFLSVRARPMLEGARHFRLHEGRREVLDERTDWITTATVVQDRVSGERLLYTDEFAAAGGGSSGYMRALGFLPFCYAPRVGDMAVLCFGTGTTAAALARVGGERPMHFVEISGAVLRMSPWFEDAFSTWSAAPTAHVRRRDGRHFVESRPDRSLALLTLEPLLPQAPGSVHLYSREFYAAADRALVQGGVCMQWVPTHALRPRDFLALLETFRTAFPETRIFLVDHSTLLLGRKAGGGADRQAPVRNRDSYLCGLWSELDLDLAEVCTGADLESADTDLLDDDAGSAVNPVVDGRPFLEATPLGRPEEILSWLPANLALLQSCLDRSADASTADGKPSKLAEARRLRLLAKQALAERLPGTAGSALAVRHLSAAVELFSSSTLLFRELQGARARLARTEGLQSLATGSAVSALSHLDRALALAPADPVVLAWRVEALWRLGRKDESLAAYGELRHFLPGFRKLPELEVQRDTTLEHLFHAIEFDIRAREPLVERSEPAEADFPGAWFENEPGARLWQLRQPVLARWLLLEALRSGQLSAGARLSRLVSALDPAGLEHLDGWILEDPGHARLVAPFLPKSLPLPAWSAYLVGGEREDQEALLRGLTARRDRASYVVLLDLLEATAPTDPFFKQVWVELIRREPKARVLEPGLDRAELRRRIQKLKREEQGK